MEVPLVRARNIGRPSAVGLEKDEYLGRWREKQCIKKARIPKRACESETCRLGHVL